METNRWQRILELMERNLRTFIEGKIAGLPETSSTLPIEEITRAIHQAATSYLSNTDEPPAGMTLSMNPYWRDSFMDQELLKDELQTWWKAFWAEQGYAALAQVTIQLDSSEELPVDEVKVIFHPNVQMVEQTQAMPIQTDSIISFPENALFILKDGTRFPLEKPEIAIGRGPENDLVINHPTVSRTHAILRAKENTYLIFDLDSRGGTFLNQRRIKQGVLSSGDVVRLADYQLVYLCDNASVQETREINLKPEDSASQQKGQQ